MKELILALTFVLMGLPALAKRDVTQWKAWKNDKTLEQRAISSFPNGPKRSCITENAERYRRLSSDLEAVLRREVLKERFAIIQAEAKGEIAPAEAANEKIRLNEALDIHLCYIYGSIFPRSLEEACGNFVSSSLRKNFFSDRFPRSEYVSMLNSNPLQGHWGDPSRPQGMWDLNLSQPIPPTRDGR